MLRNIESQVWGKGSHHYSQHLLSVYIEPSKEEQIRREISPGLRSRTIWRGQGHGFTEVYTDRTPWKQTFWNSRESCPWGGAKPSASLQDSHGVMLSQQQLMRNHLWEEIKCRPLHDAGSRHCRSHARCRDPPKEAPCKNQNQEEQVSHYSSWPRRIIYSIQLRISEQLMNGRFGAQV